MQTVPCRPICFPRIEPSLEIQFLSMIHFLGDIYNIDPMGPSIKYGTLYLANFDPLPSVTLCHTSRDPPPKVRQTPLTRSFLLGLVQKSRTKVPCANSIIVSEGFCPGGLSGVIFVLSPSVTIHLLQQKVKHHLKFHVSYV